MSDTRIASSGGKLPIDHKEIARVFRNHYAYFNEAGGEVAHVGRSGESAISREYSGRVVYELLQNAIDRAENTVEVRLIETGNAIADYQLIVKNDGPPIHVDPGYSYDEPPDNLGSKTARPDFNALCSIHTSNKSPDESIGTKGIGFRSVFSLGTYVRVWSRFAERDEWWGLEMHSPLDVDTWNVRKHDPDISRGVETYLTDSDVPPVSAGEVRPSYHFPLPLAPDGSPTSLDDDAYVSTAVVVPVMEADKSTLVDRIRDFETQHLYFTGLSRGNDGISVQFEHPDGSFTRKTSPHDADTTDESRSWSIAYWQSSDSELRKLAREAEHDVSEPGAAIAWPPRHHEAGDISEASITSAVYGYLPTLIEGPCGADLQGDFQLSIDRTNIRLDDDKMGQYNQRLVQTGAELHLLQAVRRIPGLADMIDWMHINPDEVTHAPIADAIDPFRPDLWYFLDPSIGQSNVADRAVEHIASLLFDLDSKTDPASYDIWAQLAAGYFEGRSDWPLETYRSFWEAVQNWVDYICDTKTRGVTWCQISQALCDALRSTSAPVAPIVENNDTDTEIGAITLPATGESVGTDGQPDRKEEVVYIRKQDEENLELPRVLEEDARAVTAYNFPSDLYNGSPNALGVDQFSRWSVLSELRQLPNSLERWEYEPLCSTDTEERAAERQRELLQFAAQLYRLDTGGNRESPAASESFDTGWRMRDEFSDNALQAGRAIATLFLPTTNGQWEPARQLTRPDVAVEEIGIDVDSIEVDAFLAFLGVAPEPPDDGVCLTLVEGGSDGKVEPVDVPPGLTAAGPGRRDATLVHISPTTGPVADPHAWRESLLVAWETWLQPLLNIERKAVLDDEVTARTNLVETLGKRAWFPVKESDEDTGAKPPEVGTVSRTAVAPEDITLHVPQQTEYPKLLWSVKTTAPAADLLSRLGAINGLKEERLRDDAAMPAYRLLDGLRAIEPEAVSDPRLQQTFVQLFDRLLNAIVDGDPGATNQSELWLLTHEGTDGNTGSGGIALSERALTWRSLSEAPWIAKTPSDQEVMRQHFPTVPLIAATVESLSEYPPLTDRSIDIAETVHCRPHGGVTDEITRSLVTELGELVPELLTLADATRQFDIDLTTLTERWDPQRFKRADNVWLEISSTLDGETRTRTQYRDSHGHALLTGDDGESERTLVFDTPGDDDSPPLTTFGEPLAEFLLQGQGREVGDLFARALQMQQSDEERFHAFLDDKGARPLVETYERAFDQLSPEEHDILIEQTKQALDTIDVTLKRTSISTLRSLGPADIELPADGTDLVEDDINDALSTIELPDSREWDRYYPRFSCRDAHVSKWQSWLSEHEEPLIPYLLDRLHECGFPDFAPESLKRHLDQYVRDNECPRVRFRPTIAVTRWLAHLGLGDKSIPTPERLLSTAESHASSFAPVTDVVGIEEEGLTTGEVDPPQPKRKGGGTYDLAEATQTKRTQMVRGENAENAALSIVLDRTEETLDEVASRDRIETVAGTEVTSRADALDVLRWPFYEGGITDAHVQEHIEAYSSTGDRHALGQALHISTVWDGAGFDLIGLDLDEGCLKPIRYEIKSISDDGSAPIVYLSKNQYAVYEQVQDSSDDDRQNAGEWQLLGVKSSGVAVDLTDRLIDLPDHALAALRDEGFDHDGLVLELNRMTESE